MTDLVLITILYLARCDGDVIFDGDVVRCVRDTFSLSTFSLKE
jgi:hypothetical protein